MCSGLSCSTSKPSTPSWRRKWTAPRKKPSRLLLCRWEKTAWRYRLVRSTWELHPLLKQLAVSWLNHILIRNKPIPMPAFGLCALCVFPLSFCKSFKHSSSISQRHFWGAFTAHSHDVVSVYYFAFLWWILPWCCDISIPEAHFYGSVYSSQTCSVLAGRVMKGEAGCILTFWLVPTFQPVANTLIPSPISHGLSLISLNYQGLLYDLCVCLCSYKWNRLTPA